MEVLEDVARDSGPKRSVPGTTRSVLMIQGGSGRSKSVTTMMSSTEQARSVSMTIGGIGLRRLRPPSALTAGANRRVSPLFNRGPSRARVGTSRVESYRKFLQLTSSEQKDLQMVQRDRQRRLNSVVCRLYICNTNVPTPESRQVIQERTNWQQTK